MNTPVPAPVPSSPEMYAQSVNDIQTAVSTLESQTVPSYAEADDAYKQAASAFTQMKTDAMQWVNQVHPADMTMPTVVVSAGSTITSALASLTTAAAQLAGDLSNQALQQTIADQATALATDVSTLQGKISTLVTALDGFSRTLAADQQNLGNAVNALYDDMGNLQEQLSQLNGELALQYGTFDTSGAEQTQADIQSTNDQLQQTQNLYSFCAQAGSGASSALQGLDYLAGYWGSVSTQAGQVVPILQQVSNDPASVVQLDLQAASQAWAQLLTLSQQTAGQFPATSTLMRTA